MGSLLLGVAGPQPLSCQCGRAVDFIHSGLEELEIDVVIVPTGALGLVGVTSVMIHGAGSLVGWVLLLAARLRRGTLGEPLLAPLSSACVSERAV